MNKPIVTYNGSASTRIDMRWLTDAISNAYTADQAKKLVIPLGNKKVEIGELFNISENFSNKTAQLEGSTSKLDLSLIHI